MKNSIEKISLVFDNNNGWNSFHLEAIVIIPLVHYSIRHIIKSPGMDGIDMEVTEDMVNNDAISLGQILKALNCSLVNFPKLMTEAKKIKNVLAANE